VIDFGGDAAPPPMNIVTAHVSAGAGSTAGQDSQSTPPVRVGSSPVPPRPGPAPPAATVAPPLPPAMPPIAPAPPAPPPPAAVAAPPAPPPPADEPAAPPGPAAAPPDPVDVIAPPPPPPPDEPELPPLPAGGAPPADCPVADPPTPPEPLRWPLEAALLQPHPNVTASARASTECPALRPVPSAPAGTHVEPADPRSAITDPKAAIRLFDLTEAIRSPRRGLPIESWRTRQRGPRASARGGGA
jgi:hypothetical protein